MSRGNEPSRDANPPDLFTFRLLYHSWCVGRPFPPLGFGNEQCRIFYFQNFGCADGRVCTEARAGVVLRGYPLPKSRISLCVTVTALLVRARLGQGCDPCPQPNTHTASSDRLLRILDKAKLIKSIMESGNLLISFNSAWFVTLRGLCNTRCCAFNDW